MDLLSAVDRHHYFLPSEVVALNDEEAVYDYGPEVKFEIDHPDSQSYSEAARWINSRPSSIVSVQHEFGLFGGYGLGEQDQLVPFLEQIKKPVVTTLHTVLPHPKPHIREIVRQICRLSQVVVVMVDMARLILADDYGIEAEKLRTIPHGVPTVPKKSDTQDKRDLKLEGRKVLATIGLLSRGKGIEYVIEAMPAVLEENPEAIYLILGTTHPHIRQKEGEAYRKKLMRRVEELGLKDHVKFNNRFLTQREIIRYLHATDIYITPYLNRDQITSGTLAYAVGAGKALISTPYIYAQEILAEGRGMLAKFKSSASIGRCVNLIFGTPGLKEHLETEASKYGRRTSWSKVARQYITLFEEVVRTETRAKS